MSRLDDVERQISNLEYERRILEEQRERRLEAIYGVTRCPDCGVFPKVRYSGGFTYYDCDCGHR